MLPVFSFSFFQAFLQLFMLEVQVIMTVTVGEKDFPLFSILMKNPIFPQNIHTTS